MPLDEYRRKRNFNATPEPPPEVPDKPGHRFVVQKHQASHLHYDFRLEMEGVLKSWAVPKGPSLDPADKRLAMMTEDHPVSYFHFEGHIPPGNYGAGTVQVWDTGTWEPEGNASEMLKKGDLKFRLKGEKLHGSYVLARMKSRRPGSKGNEWLLIKHRDDAVVAGYNIDLYDYSVLTQRSLEEIANDEGSAEWQSNRAAAPAKAKDWLADSIKVADNKKATTKKKSTAKTKAAPEQASAAPKRPARKTAAPSPSGSSASPSASSAAGKAAAKQSSAVKKKSKPSAAAERAAKLKGAVAAAMPREIAPMLATLTDEPFQSKDYLYEVKWDGYRAIAYVENGRVRLMSRNGIEMTHQYPELQDIATHLRASSAIVDGEIVALDETGRPSFSVMQQRTGIGSRGRRSSKGNADIPVLYYAFDLLYADGYDLRGVNLIDRKELLGELLLESSNIKFSEHFDDGLALYEAASAQQLEGIVAKRRNSCYVGKRSREWLKIKLTQMQECVIGGWTDPKGSREHFGSVILGLYDERDRLVHVGQAGSGFNAQNTPGIWKRLKELAADKSPFTGKVDTSRRNHWVRPELVAQIKFVEWTHEGQSGNVKMRAPVFLGLRMDKDPKECRFERPTKLAEAA